MLSFCLAWLARGGWEFGWLLCGTGFCGKSRWTKQLINEAQVWHFAFRCTYVSKRRVDSEMYVGYKLTMYCVSQFCTREECQVLLLLQV